MSDTFAHETSANAATVRSAATGDEIAFSRLVAQHHAAMARVAYVVCGDAETTRDAVQSAWTVAWRRIGSVRQPDQIRSWLIAIAANEARQAVRRQRRQVVVELQVAADRSGDTDPTADVTVLDLARVLRSLKADDRVLLALRFEAGLDSTEIAARLGMSASGVRSRLARLIERLRDDLALGPETGP